MRRRKKKRKNEHSELKRKEMFFSLPLQDFLILFPRFPLPYEIDSTDLRYIVRFRLLRDGRVLTDFDGNRL